MGTPCLVARATSADEDPSWVAVIINHDGYPTGVGRRLYELAHKEFGGDGTALASYLISNFPEGISDLDGDDYLPGGKYHDDAWPGTELSKGSGLLPYRNRHHKSDLESKLVTSDDPHFDWFFYLLTRDGMTVHKTHMTDTELGAGIVVLFDRPEPDWQAIEDHLPS